MKRARCLAAALLLAVAVTGALAQDRPLSRPAGGWTASGLVDDPQRVEYAYPANLIDRGGQRGRTLIEGRLSQVRKAGTRTPTLVVNGNAMPLYTGDDGRYARPYAFGAGSNGIELRDGDGRVLQRVQFYEANRLKTQARVRAILAWDDPQAELDLHVITPDGGHAFFANPVLPNGGGLDVDSVDGAGPEMFSMTAPLPGPYHVYVNYWGNFGAGGYHFDEATRQQPVITARITLVFDENTGAERRETFTVPMRKIGDLTLVRSFVR
ncbi:YfaP family protein [Aquabacterium sp.]|uniref:YfaP family protein n=1 Tax=Aquabacterium sp. TaxID=1872578 RepID=UPI0037851392